MQNVEETLQIYLNSKYANRYNASTSDIDFYFSPFSIPSQLFHHNIIYIYQYNQHKYHIVSIMLTSEITH